MRPRPPIFTRTDTLFPYASLCRSGLRDTRLEIVVAAHDRLVGLRAAGDVVRLDRQHLLQRVGGAVGFQRPHFHFTEALTAELRLAAQRSEENTSELQSLMRISYAVFCFKKQTTTNNIPRPIK